MWTSNNVVVRAIVMYVNRINEIRSENDPYVAVT